MRERVHERERERGRKRGGTPHCPGDIWSHVCSSLGGRPLGYEAWLDRSGLAAQHQREDGGEGVVGGAEGVGEGHRPAGHQRTSRLQSPPGRS